MNDRTPQTHPCLRRQGPIDNLPQAAGVPQLATPVYHSIGEASGQINDVVNRSKSAFEVNGTPKNSRETVRGSYTHEQQLAGWYSWSNPLKAS